jgi:hypothetical protein
MSKKVVACKGGASLHARSDMAVIHAFLGIYT